MYSHKHEQFLIENTKLFFSLITQYNLLSNLFLYLEIRCSFGQLLSRAGFPCYFSNFNVHAGDS